jgi:hypothetical protein
VQNVQYSTAHEGFIHPLSKKGRSKLAWIVIIMECLMDPGIRYPTGSPYSADLKLFREPTVTVCTTTVCTVSSVFIIREGRVIPLGHSPMPLEIPLLVDAMIVTEIHARTPMSSMVQRAGPTAWCLSCMFDLPIQDLRSPINEST